YGKPYEILLVDDGSNDGTRDVLRELAAIDPHLRLVLFRRNYGQTAATWSSTCPPTSRSSPTTWSRS
ncbi:MAG: glycosyltransferase, partial [Planctomycetota bacterium]